ncbi:uncharacterized protein ASCRUDRAFT_74782 [Ascoidea rubescens DSM 1968]|uniref:Uncharacterized protein n=1 Tax=Ascoidea rubescens DSM 1968 TaxID=1344418 RepID=A0A1D2VLA5_9ASCO|nr:hypothetical protein ASCRUDRAFT_74782 [Ascoidea rubescens DSM 1968]ODV62398.1 hypothetical protein ASCRUDRAFT_74782 [Ascoidea rubescens DSM 1968]
MLQELLCTEVAEHYLSCSKPSSPSQSGARTVCASAGALETARTALETHLETQHSCQAVHLVGSFSFCSSANFGGLGLISASDQP